MKKKDYHRTYNHVASSSTNHIKNYMVEIEHTDNILLIEDNPGDARLVQILLRQTDLLNCTITHVSSLSEGMRRLEKGEKYAAVLLDLSLPDSSGFDTLAVFLEQYPRTNVIVLTGFSDKQMGVRAVQSGAQDFLVKGNFDADLLAKTLRYSIERNRVIKRLEETQRIAHIGSWEFSPETQQFTASDEVYRIFGFKPKKEIFGFSDIQETTHPFFIFNKIHDESTSIHPDTFQKDLKIPCVNGSMRNVYVQCSLHQKPNGNTFYTGIIQDITERKQAEARIIKSQARYQNIFSKSNDAIFIATFDGTITDFNRATINLTAYNNYEIKQYPLQHIFGNEDFWSGVIEDVQNGVTIKDREMVFEDKKGKEIFCLLTASPLELENFEGFNCIIRDITERKHAEELRKARDLAKQSAQLKEKFIASISHEMRTPMNAILGMSNLVLKTKGLSEEQLNYIQSIQQSSEILLGIVNDILDVATLQNGKIKFENSDFDLHDLLANLVNVMVYKMNEKELDFELAIAEDVPRRLKGDKIRLNQILYNLVGNAIKFTDEGYIKIKVDKLNESAGSVHVKFMVEDTGIGIPEEKIGAIFESFTRIHTKDRLFEGTGLGLSIAKDLVEYQGGKIWAESKLGVGSKFYFDLILETADYQTPAQTPLEPEKEVMLASDYPFQLLLVEDHKMNQLVAKKTLERQWENIQITIAENGQQAIDILNHQTFDIILMDIQMPIMDGYKTTKHIRNNMPERVSKTPILAMTAHAHISKDGKFKEYGMDDFVLKPFEPEQLFAKISKYVHTPTGR